MNHWGLVLQDIWAVARWGLPAVLLFLAGANYVRAADGDQFADHFGYICFVGGILLYVAAVAGWWV